MLSAACNATVNDITLPKSRVAPHFDFLDLRSAMVLLVMLLASHDANASAYGVTRTKKSCCTSFQLS